jgi:hypothetical protein
MKLVSRITLASALAIALSPLGASAADLPQARKLIDAHIKAIGGAKAIDSNSDGTTKATMEIVEAGLKGDMTMYQRGADMVMTLSFPTYGETKLGVIGDVSWSIDPQNGPRLLQGKEREQLVQQNDDNYSKRDKSLIASATTTALSDSEGRACYRVEIEWKTGDKTADCYSVDDGLMVSSEATVSSPMGEIKQVTHMYDYKAVGPVKMAYKAKSKLAGMTQAIAIQSYDGVKPGDEIFVLPPAIEALVKKQDAAGSK